MVAIALAAFIVALIVAALLGVRRAYVRGIRDERILWRLRA